MATRNLRDAGKRFFQLASDIEANTNDLVKKVAVRVHYELVLQTPVDTGQARSNWQMALNYPPTGTLGPYVPGQFGSTRGRNAQEAIIAGLNALDAKKPGQDIWIVNNLPYISGLNDGASYQAGAGFVEASVRIGASVVKQARVVTPSGR